MASHYLKVIKSVQPEGPFSILGTCLSDPICVEINNQMRQKGEAPIALVIVDSSPFHLFQRKRILTPKNVRIERFLERFRQSPYRAIRKMVIDRVNKLVSPVKVNLEEIKVQYGRDSHAKNLQEIRRQLQKLYYQYNWGPFKGKITLIKTTQNVERPNNWDEGVWARLASEKVDLLVIPGEHYTRFEEPDVIGMANQLQAYLDQLYQTHGLKI
jgi:surfactin synthase thioesterase subunit